MNSVTRVLCRHENLSDEFMPRCINNYHRSSVTQSSSFLQLTLRIMCNFRFFFVPVTVTLHGPLGPKERIHFSAPNLPAGQVRDYVVELGDLDATYTSVRVHVDCLASDPEATKLPLRMLVGANDTVVSSSVIVRNFMMSYE